MNILSITAHPDDFEILCAGTLIRYAQEGNAVTSAVFTGGSMGDNLIEPKELESMRKKETEAAARIIGANVIWGGMVDEHVFPDKEQRHRMIDILREVDPDVIFTHSPYDYHPDHRYVSQLVFDSYFQKGLSFIPDQKKAACRFGHTTVYYLDNLGGIGFLPNEYVDITDVFSIKKEMLACHKSQLESMKSLANIDMQSMVETQALFRGLAAGCQYAEGFRMLDAFQRGMTRRILP